MDKQIGSVDSCEGGVNVQDATDLEHQLYNLLALCEVVRTTASILYYSSQSSIYFRWVNFCEWWFLQ